ncbi:MAG: AglZ/HisF2 family acetamidino modification protein [Candidatus Omnitrophota bacterium]
MKRYRVIPVLLLRNGGLCKTVKFKDPKYVGDPINAVKIFNEKEVDELVFLDIESMVMNREPDCKKLRDIASECFMPLCYGGGIRNLKQIEKILKIGVEKVSVNSALVEQPELVRQAVTTFGSSTIVGSIDYRRNLLGKSIVHIRSGSLNTGLSVEESVKRAEDLGVGEILLNSIDRDGTMTGYDLDVIKAVSKSLSVPLIACGGAGSLRDFYEATHDAGASAVAAGAFFVFTGRWRAVLITYPSQEELETGVFR